MAGILEHKELIARVLRENPVYPLKRALTSFSKDLEALDVAQSSRNVFSGWMHKRVTANYFQILRAEIPGYFTEDTVLLFNDPHVIYKTIQSVNLHHAQIDYLLESTISSRWDFVLSFIRNLFGSMEHMERDDRVRVFERIFSFIDSSVIPPEELNDQDIFKSLLINLMKYFGQDSKAVMSCLRDFCHIDGALSRNLFEHSSYHENYLDFVLFHARRMRCAYNTIWNGLGCGFGVLDYPLCYCYPSVNMTPLMLFDRMACIPILLKYGYRFQFSPLVYIIMHKLLTWSGDRWITVPNAKALSVLKEFKHREMMALYIYFTFTVCHSKHREEALLYISRSDPSPLISPSFIYNTLSQAMMPDYHSELRNICLYYEKLELYDEHYSIYEPRTLSHLARCATRKRLADNYQLPDGIEDLGLPERLKQYLYLHE